MGQSPAGEDCNREGLGLPLLNGPTEFGPSHPEPTQFTTDPKKRALPGDLLFCVRGSTTGRMNWADQEYAIGRGIAAIRHKLTPKLQPLVRAVIEQHLPVLLQAATGSTFPNVSGPQLAAIPFPNVAPTDALAIAFVLGALDDKIELNRRMNETLEAMARAIFKDWFVDFGPTRAKAEGRAPYLAPDIWSLFPDRLDDEGKPEGWDTGSLADFMQFQGGTQPPASDFVGTPREGYVRLLQIRDFSTSAHLTFIPDSGRLRKVDADDICIGRYGSGTGDEKDSLGRLCRGLAGAINVALVKVHPLFECREWLATYIGSGEFRRAISGGSARAVQAGFRQEDLKYIKLTRAPRALYAAFERVGELAWSKKKLAGAESETLAATRDFLLPKLMSGEVRVKDAEKLVGEAT